MAVKDITASNESGDREPRPKRRDFLLVASGALGGVAAAATVWPLIDQLNPSADVLAMASTEVNLSPVEVGQSITIMWQGKPVFVRHRSAKEISEAENTPLTELKDPQADSARVIKPEWLIVVGICTHLGCVPLAYEGIYDGYFCPCHGSVYDTSGRIRQGPAPSNLDVPKYTFLSDTSIRIG